MPEQSYGNNRDGRKVVAVAGTRERLASANTRCAKVIIMAEVDNTGYIVVGDVTVVASLATRRGIPLSAGTSLTMYVEDLFQVYLDAEVSGDGVTFQYFF